MKLLADKLAIRGGARIDPLKVDKLSLSRADITDTDSFSKCAMLKVVDLSHNKIAFLRQLDGLLEAPALESLDLTGNPVVRKPNYREYILSKCPTLRVLDGQIMSVAPELPAIQVPSGMELSASSSSALDTPGPSSSPASITPVTSGGAIAEDDGAIVDDPIFRNARRRGTSSVPALSVSESSTGSSAMPVSSTSSAASLPPKPALIPLTESTVVSNDQEFMSVLQYLTSSFNPAMAMFSGDIVCEVTGLTHVVLRVGDGKCDVFTSIVEPAPYLVKISASRDTFSGMLSGTIDAMMAVMGGLMTVSDLGFALLFTQAFPVSKDGYAAFLEKQKAKPCSSTTIVKSIEDSSLLESDPELAFALMFVPKAYVGSSVTGDIHFLLDDNLAFTVRLEPTVCTVFEGRQSSSPPMLEIKCSRDVLQGLLAGTLDATTAVFGGQLLMSDLSSAMVFATAFKFDRSAFASYRDEQKHVRKSAVVVPTSRSGFRAFTDSDLHDMDIDLGLALLYIPRAYVGSTIPGDVLFTLGTDNVFTIRLESSACSVFFDKDPAGKPLLEVTCASDVFKGLLAGTIDATTAVFSGQLAVSDLSAAMVFATAFQFQRDAFTAFVAEQRKQHNSSAKSTVAVFRPIDAAEYLRSDEDLGLALLYIPKAFQGSSILGDVLFVLGDNLTFTIRLESSLCNVYEGRDLNVSPLLELKCTRDVFKALLAGTIDAPTAMFSGQLTVSDLTAALMFGTSFKFDRGDFHRMCCDYHNQVDISISLTEKERLDLEAAFQILVQSWNGSMLPLPAKLRVAGTTSLDIVVRTTSETISVERASDEKDEQVLFTLECSAETLAQFLSGRISYSRLFQDGIITASMISPMVLFASAFNFPIAVPASDVVVSGSQVPEAERLQEALQFLPLAYNVTSWNGIIHFSISVDNVPSVNAWTVVDSGSVHVSTENAGGRRVSCTVTIDRGTLLNILDGSTTYMKAFSQGKVKVDNLPELLNFAQAFSFDRAKYQAFVEARRSGKSAEETASAMAAVKERKKSFFDAGVSKIVGAVAQLKTRKSAAAADMSPAPVEKPYFADLATDKPFKQQRQPSSGDEPLVSEMEALFAGRKRA